MCALEVRAAVAAAPAGGEVMAGVARPGTPAGTEE